MMNSLFESGNIVYVADTSALITLELTFPPDGPTFKAIWEEIDELIGIKCFRIIDYVEEEINSYKGAQDFLKKWIAQRKKKGKLVFETDEECFIAAIPIINEEFNTGFLNSRKLAEGKEEADPYLIAYCKLNGFTLITSESKTKPNKMPAVATKNGIKCIDIYEFLKERNLKMIRDIK